MAGVLNKLLVLALAGGMAAGACAQSDDEKLEALRRAMTGGEGSGVVNKPKTRAIMFDSAPEASTPASAVPAVLNCSQLSPDTRGSQVDFAIQFRVNSADILPGSIATLNSVGKILSLDSKRCVIVEGHTDVSGNADRNMQLSAERANSVVNYLVDKTGLDRSRFIPVGKGSSDTLRDIDKRDPRNRRVVFRVVG